MSCVVCPVAGVGHDEKRRDYEIINQEHWHASVFWLRAALVALLDETLKYPYSRGSREDGGLEGCNDPLDIGCRELA